MYYQFDDARERTGGRLSQVILDRRTAISSIAQGISHSEKLSIHHLWAEKLHTAILGHAQAANMAVVARVLNLLPRELRDIVYMHLWATETNQDPSRELLYWWDSFDEPWFDKGEDLSGSPWLTTLAMGLRPPHFVDQAFVGGYFAREALKCFKDIVGKDLRPIGGKNPVAECGLIDASMVDFVEKDMFGVGMTMGELVRNLDLRVTFQCDVLSLGEYAEPGVVRKEGCSLEEYLTELDSGVTALCRIPYLDRITTQDGILQRVQTRPRIITLAIRQEYNHYATVHLISLLKLVAHAYLSLREKGFTLKVQYYSEEAGLKVLFEDDVWTWTSEDWKANLGRKNSIPVDPGHRATHFQDMIWKLFRNHLFQRPDSTSSSGNSKEFT
ncbi:hypothetical protein EJ02DRAFT_462770 [Clathrospora elynae]|uniref:Uncharacterized protein n=1 Tax=Clathrospora elynae TaxID=706981 RepID=A0A6A5T267_9PLEO|nr:hypothetical protein EJ02DRAFT_462770 [Clathrospora elynae]